MAYLVIIGGMDEEILLDWAKDEYDCEFWFDSEYLPKRDIITRDSDQLDSELERYGVIFKETFVLSI